MKAISFSHVLYSIRFYIKVLKNEIHYNKDYLQRQISTQNKEIMLKYKDNFEDFLNGKDYLYFMIAPTLCYQLVYPKTNKIRKRWLLKRIFELILAQGCQLFITLEFYMPVLRKSPEVFLNKPIDIYYILEAFKYLVQLSLPNTIVWVLGFVIIFHLFLNIVSELIYFGDREFYLEWWNCSNLSQYWRFWNLPVHHWFIRHISYPLQYRGVSKSICNLFIFVISAAVHEYLLSLAIGKVGFLVFLSFTYQYYYIIFEIKFLQFYKLENTNTGNLLFWWNMCVLAQPILAIIYFIDTVKK